MNAKSLLLWILPLLLPLAACAPAAATAMPRPVSSTMPAALPTQAPQATMVAVAETVANRPAPAGQMILKDATLVLTVRDVDQALDTVTALAADNGGYLIRSETWAEDDEKHAALNLAVPSARFEAALNQLRRLAIKVDHETTSGQDVTAEYTDLRSQLVNLEATAARVRAFLDDATTVEESLRINAELSRLEGEIERITGQMRFYEGRAAFSTINVRLQPEPAPVVEEPPPAWNPLATVERASRVALSIAQSAVDLAIWVVFIAGPPVVIAMLLLLGFRLVLRPRPARQA